MPEIVSLHDRLRAPYRWHVDGAAGRHHALAPHCPTPWRERRFGPATFSPGARRPGNDEHTETHCRVLIQIE